MEGQPLSLMPLLEPTAVLGCLLGTTYDAHWLGDKCVPDVVAVVFHSLQWLTLDISDPRATAEFGAAPQLPRSVRFLRLTNRLGAARTPMGLLKHCTQLRRVDLSELSTVIDVQEQFLMGCSGLTRIDLTGLRNAGYVGDSFLAHCAGLASVDLSPLAHAEAIGVRALSRCTSLRVVDATRLGRVGSVGLFFLSGSYRRVLLKVPALRDGEALSAGGRTLQRVAVRLEEELAAAGPSDDDDDDDPEGASWPVL